MKVMLLPVNKVNAAALDIEQQEKLESGLCSW